MGALQTFYPPPIVALFPCSPVNTPTTPAYPSSLNEPHLRHAADPHLLSYKFLYHLVLRSNFSLHVRKVLLDGSVSKQAESEVKIASAGLV